MSDAPEGTTDDSVDAGAPVETGSTSGPEETSYDPSSGADNPAWAPYKEVLHGAYYDAVKPILRQNDLEVQKRFDSIRNEYKLLEQYKGLDVPAERIQQVMPIADMLDNDPVQFYQLFVQHPQIKAFLESQQANLEPEFPEEAEGDQTEGQFDITQDPRFQQMQEQVQGFQQMMEQQEQQRKAAEVDQEVEQEVSEFRGRRPDYTNQDMAILFNTIAGQHAATGKLISFDDAAKQLDSYRESLISAPRPGAGAPRVMPTNGGAPSPNTPANLGKLSSKETRGLLAGIVDSLKSQ